jgi:acyl-CoA synthetase (AMP-forming)/AMP-acid ligase II
VSISFAGVFEAAVVAEPGPVLCERVHAFVVAHPSLKLPGLKRHCVELLAGYKVPETFTLRGEPLAQRQWQAAEAQPARVGRFKRLNLTYRTQSEPRRSKRADIHLR